MLPLIIALLGFISTWYFWDKSKKLKRDERNKERGWSILVEFRGKNWEILSRHLDRVQHILYRGFLDVQHHSNSVRATGALDKARSELVEWMTDKESITPSVILDQLRELEAQLIDGKDETKIEEADPVEILATASERVWECKRKLRAIMGL